MTVNIPDALDFARWHEEEEAKAEAKLPVCEDCGEIIYDEYYYDVDGDILCEECLKDRYRHYTEDYDGYDD